MIINLTEKYYLKVDERQYAVVERTGRVYESGAQKGKPVDKTLAYPATLKQALNYLARLTVIDGHDELSLAEYLTELRTITETLTRACKGV